MDISGIRKSIKEFEFSKLFIEYLGWEYPEDSRLKTVQIKNSNGFFSYKYQIITEINGIPILKFNKEKLRDFDNSEEKKKLHKEIKIKLLKKPEIRKDYLKTKEINQLQRDYFRKSYQYQSGKVINFDGKTRQSSSHINTYGLCTERCFELLNKEGFLGIALPNALCKNDGAIGLRREILFKQVKVEGLIDFQNQMETPQGIIFEGVHPWFRFLLLNIKKGSPKDNFPCLFYQKSLKVLENFPEKAIIQSVQEIEKLSPRDCSIKVK